MNTTDTKVAEQIDEIDELLRRSSIEQQRINVAGSTDRQAICAEGVLTEMLTSIDRLTKYRAKLTRHHPPRRLGILRPHPASRTTEQR
jgi:hypothetical protein